MSIATNSSSNYLEKAVGTAESQDKNKPQGDEQVEGEEHQVHAGEPKTQGEGPQTQGESRETAARSTRFVYNPQLDIKSRAFTRLAGEIFQNNHPGFRIQSSALQDIQGAVEAFMITTFEVSDLVVPMLVAA
ncbi:hypothetical protein H2201_005666 [Coniosporium apollinis]|uniref:Histone H2A/H2B/H3 domain-containing protein n=1 Tax=Coniosporium apollinis TaxID=61459 RepID=A0ABQ9NRM7_9PEZI|nr:hypothetical protein H2201_005666 [Coniosporium apollinis]